MSNSPQKNNSAGHLQPAPSTCEKNTFLQVDPDISKAAYILRSFTSPLNMLAPAEEAESSSETASQSTAGEDATFHKAPGGQRRRSVVVPFGPFETGEVVSVGMLDVQEKLEKFTAEKHHDKRLGDHMPQGRNRRGSVVSVFFSPDHSQADDDEFKKIAPAAPGLDPIGTVKKDKEATKKKKVKKSNKGIDLSDPKFAGQLVIDGTPESLCTTLMVRNIPNKYTQRLLVNLFKQYGFDRTFDFLYVPVDFNTRLNVGYCFINFTDPEYTQAFAKRFHGFHMPAFKSRKRIHISLANLQGLQPNIKKLVDSSLMLDTVAPEYQPLLFCAETGHELPFPSPANLAVEKVTNRLSDPDKWEREDEKLVPTWAGSVFPRNPPQDDHKKHSGPPRHHNNIGNAGKGMNDQVFFNQNMGSYSPPPSPPSSRHQSDRSMRGYTPQSMPPVTPPYSPYSPGPDHFGFTPPGLSRSKGGYKGGKGDHGDWTPPPGGRHFRAHH